MKSVVFGAVSVGALNNGRSVTPPLGWRSWNLFGAGVTQPLIQSQMAGMVDKSRGMSLLDLGYSDVGLDDNWQECGSYGPNKYTFHSEEGRPIVNPVRFPDFQAMTNFAHENGLTAGWYGNNCICSDHCSTPECYQGDVDATLDYGFDSIKLDGCGAQRDLTLYANLFNQTGKAIMIENCHWGGTVPNATWLVFNVRSPAPPISLLNECPWNYFRTSGDVRASYSSVVSNLQTTIQWAENGLSAPGCWAYPDMLEVGCQHGPGGPSDPGLSDDETASHFGAWCIVSSPLILSHDLTNKTVMDRVWPLISNKDALKVNQAWDGFSGSVFLQANATVALKDVIQEEAPVPVWQMFYKPIGAGQIAVFLMNHDSVSATLNLPFSAVPGLSSTTVDAYDVWAQKDLGTVTTSWSVTLRTHQSAFLILTPK